MKAKCRKPARNKGATNNNMNVRLRFKFFAAIFLLVVSWSFVSVPASVASSRADMQRARQEFLDKGDDLYQDGRYEAAKEAWQSALSMDPWNGRIKKRIREVNEKMRHTAKGDVRIINIQETAHATKLSQRLVEEYHRLFDDYAVTNAKFDVLLKGMPKT